MNQRKAGALLSYVYLGLTCIIGLVYTPFSLYCLGEGEYGVFSLALSVISFLTILDFGFNQTMIRYVSRCKAMKDKEGEERINGMFLILYSGIALIALIAGVVLTFFIEDIFTGSGFGGLTEWEAMRLKIIFAILLINLVGSFPMGVYTAILNANEGFVVLKGINILTVVLTYSGMTIAMLCGYKAVAMAVITTVVSLALKLIQGIYVQHKYKPRFRMKGWDRKLFREVFVFSFFIFLNIVIDQLYANTDKFILGIVQSSAVVTVYSVGVQFTAYFEQFSTSISGVFLPRITELTTKKKDMKEVSGIFVRIGRIQFILLGFLISGFIVFGRQFIGLWVGEGMDQAYAIALVVIVPALIPLSQNIGISVIRALNRHRFRSVMYLGIAILNVGLSIPMAIWFGGFGAACITGLGTCLGQILTMNWFYWKRIGLDIPGYWREAGKILLVLIPTGAIGWGIHMLPFWDGLTVWGGWLSFLLQVLIYSFLFLAVAWAFVFNPYEKDLVRGFLRVVIRIILRFVPMKDDVMLESHPDFSGNTYEVYKELLKRGYQRDHRIYWCVYDEKSVPEELPEGVFCVYKHKAGLRATWQRLKATARCRYIIDSNSYVHKVRGSQVRLHLGHGMPIKLLPEYTNYDEIGDCDGYLTCGIYWRSIYTETAHIPAEKLLPIGYPRNDVLVKGATGSDDPHGKGGGDPFEKVSEAGVDVEKKSASAMRTAAGDVATIKDVSNEADRRLSTTEKGREHGFFWHLPERERFILWMPTYRQHRNQADESQPSELDEMSVADTEVRSNTTSLSDERAAADAALEEGRWEVLAMEQLRKLKAPRMPYGMPEVSGIKELQQLDELLEELDLRIYFRPHPAQDMRYIAKVSPVNIRIADDEFLARCEMSLYEVLRESEALITDYSSVYFDYLLTDKPIGLTLRDADTFFRDCICCFEDLREEIAGDKLECFDDVLAFVRLVAGGAADYDALVAELGEAKKWFHDVTDGSSTERVMAWLQERGMPL